MTKECDRCGLTLSTSVNELQCIKDDCPHPVIPIGDLAPCLDSLDGLHCGHEVHEHVSIGMDPLFRRMRIKCCWCDALETVSITTTKVAFTGHGPGCSYEDEVWELVIGWKKGDA